MTEEKLLTAAKCQEMANLMTSKYRSYLNGKTLEISVTQELEGVKARVLMKNHDESFYYPIEARMLHLAQEMAAKEALLFLLDYIDLYIEEFLQEDSDLLLTIDWSDHQYDAVNFQMRGLVINRRLEEQAEALLTPH